MYPVCHFEFHCSQTFLPKPHDFQIEPQAVLIPGERDEVVTNASIVGDRGAGERGEKVYTQSAFQEALNFAYDPNQPRDEPGRFARISIARAKINPDTMSSDEIAAYIEDVSDRARQHAADRSQGDWFLRELARDQGFDGLPDVVTKEQMDE